MPQEKEPYVQGRLLRFAAQVFADGNLPPDGKPGAPPLVTETTHESDGLVTLVNGCCDTSDMSDHDDRNDDMGDGDPFEP